MIFNRPHRLIETYSSMREDTRENTLKSPPSFLKANYFVSITQLSRFYIGQVASLLQIPHETLPIITNFPYFSSILEDKKLQIIIESPLPHIFATFQESTRM